MWEALQDIAKDSGVWEALRHIATPLGLLAFAIAIGGQIYQHRLAARTKLISTAPSGERAALVDKVLETYSITSDNLTRDQKYSLMELVILQRAARMRWISSIALVAGCLVIAGLLLSVIVSRPTSSLSADIRQQPADIRSTLSRMSVANIGDLILLRAHTPYIKGVDPSAARPDVRALEKLGLVKVSKLPPQAEFGYDLSLTSRGERVKTFLQMFLTNASHIAQ